MTLQSRLKIAFNLTLFSLLCMLPALLLGWDLFTDQLGANPVEALEHTTGNWVVYFLLLTLSVSPLQKALKTLKRTSFNASKWLIPVHLVRRILGLSAFGYALLHATAYLLFDMGLSWEDTLIDLVDRPFILIGFIALLLLVPLAVTSTQGWQCRLKRHWQTLHSSIYLLTFLGILHYALLVKADLLMPLLYFGLFATLMLMRFRRPKNR
ncbi:MAG: sulfoxide reductase heme-binding subunit YedZ [Gammaproteobacteria bacterium]|nr:sulfoxide reductase heme-binding subunit YedZ [Gammaproteobacteria bacterium]